MGVRVPSRVEFLCGVRYMTAHQIHEVGAACGECQSALRTFVDDGDVWSECACDAGYLNGGPVQYRVLAL